MAQCIGSGAHEVESITSGGGIRFRRLGEGTHGEQRMQRVRRTSPGVTQSWYFCCFIKKCIRPNNMCPTEGWYFEAKSSFDPTSHVSSTRKHRTSRRVSREASASTNLIVWGKLLEVAGLDQVSPLWDLEFWLTLEEVSALLDEVSSWDIFNSNTTTSSHLQHRNGSDERTKVGGMLQQRRRVYEGTLFQMW